MCIILDINILSSVFSQAAMKHREFEPVLKWITEGHGRVVYGGTKYKKELGKTPYLKIFSLLNIYNRAIPLMMRKSIKNNNMWNPLKTILISMIHIL